MKYIFPSAIVFSFLMMSCQGQSVHTTNTKPSNAPVHPGYSNSLAGRTPSAPYELHGIIDPGMNNMVAFALQTPTNWSVQQSFTRAWNGSTPINQIYVRATAPDQSSMIDFLPYTPYYYSDGATARSLRQTATAYGVQQAHPGEMPPMYPVDYIKRVLLPQLAQRGLQMRPAQERNLQGKQTGANTQVLYGYVDGVMNSGKKVRVDCMITMMTTNMGDNIYYNWEAYPTVLIASGDLDANYAHVTNARNTFRVNPSWQQKNQQLVRNGNTANKDISEKNYNMTRDYYDHVQRTGDEIARMRNNSSDKRNESFGDVMSGQAKYESSITGERIRLADKYNHVYKDKQGNYIGSDSPEDNVQFDWEELQRVETKNY